MARPAVNPPYLGLNRTDLNVRVVHAIKGAASYTQAARALGIGLRTLHDYRAYLRIMDMLPGKAPERLAPMRTRRWAKNLHDVEGVSLNSRELTDADQAAMRVYYDTLETVRVSDLAQMFGVTPEVVRAVCEAGKV